MYGIGWISVQYSVEQYTVWIGVNTECTVQYTVQNVQHSVEWCAVHTQCTAWTVYRADFSTVQNIEHSVQGRVVCNIECTVYKVE